MTRASAGRGAACLIWAITYLFFLFTLANNFSASHDSINYLNNIVNGKHLFHQHHLLYHFLANKWLHLLQPLFHEVPEHYLIESFTAIWGSGALAVCYLFFRNRFFLPNALSVFGVMLIAFSYGTWFYSVNIEVYTPPLFFLLWSLYIITRKEPQRNDIWRIAMLHSMAILFHQVNVLFGFVVLQWIYANRKHVPPSPAVFKYFTTGVVVVGVTYFLIGWFVEGNNNSEAFVNWILGYSVGHGYWQPLSLHTPMQVLAGFSRAFIGAHFIFQVTAVDTFLENSFRAHSLRDEIFLSEQVSSAMAWLLLVLAVVFGALMIALIVRFIRHVRSMKMHFHVLNPILLSLLVYSLFFIFWMPEILEFWIFQMVLVWLLLIGMLPLIRFPFGITARTGALLMVLMLFAMNYFGSMKWLQRIDNDWFYVEMKKMPAVTPGDVVIVENQWILKDYVRHYTAATVIATDEPDYDVADARKKINDAKAAGHHIYLYRNDPGKPVEEWTLIQSY
jgi:hypothetical protein